MWRHRISQFNRFVATAAVISVIVASGTAEAGGDWSVTAGPGVYSNYWTSGALRQVSVGGESLLGSHFGVGADGSLLIGGGDASIASALHASLHLRQHDRANHMDPFIRGGYTRLSFLTESNGTNALNLGGGFNYWFSDDGAWVVEFRAVSPTTGFASRLWLASVGIRFR
jgi:hypothetical protein